MWITCSQYGKKHNISRQLVEHRAKSGKIKSRKIIKKLLRLEVWDK